MLRAVLWGVLSAAVLTSAASAQGGRYVLAWVQGEVTLVDKVSVVMADKVATFKTVNVGRDGALANGLVRKMTIDCSTGKIRILATAPVNGGAEGPEQAVGESAGEYAGPAAFSLTNIVCSSGAGGDRVNSLAEAVALGKQRSKELDPATWKDAIPKGPLRSMSGSSNTATYVVQDETRMNGDQGEVLLLTVHDPMVRIGGKSAGHSLMRFSLDCKARTYTQMGSAYYDGAGAIATIYGGAAAAPIPRDTVVDFASAALCPGGTRKLDPPIMGYQAATKQTNEFFARIRKPVESKPVNPREFFGID